MYGGGGLRKGKFILLIIYLLSVVSHSSFFVNCHVCVILFLQRKIVFVFDVELVFLKESRSY